MDSKKIFFFLFTFCFISLLTGCRQKNESNVVYYYIKDFAYIRHERFLYNPKYSNGTPFLDGSKEPLRIDTMAARQYFSVLKKECQKHKEIQPMSNYIRQYIGYREHGKKFICIRFFNYIKEINGLQVNMSYTVVYMGKNDHHYGYMIYDCDDKRVVKFEYHE